MARITKMAREKICLTGCTHCCPNFLISLTRPASLYCEEYVYIHTSDCLQCTYTNYRYQTTLRVKHFYTNRGRCEVLTGYLQMGRQPNGDWANTWRWTKNFTVFFSNRSSSSPSYVQIFFIFTFIQEAFIKNIIILLGINYTI